MIVRLYKKKYLNVDESEMKFIDGLADGLITVLTLVLIYNVIL